jgi:hypothetical protein
MVPKAGPTGTCAATASRRSRRTNRAPGTGRSGSRSTDRRTSTDSAGALFETGATLGTLGDIIDGKLSFDWYRDSGSTSWEHLIPALRLHLETESASGGTQRIQLIWEGMYNDYPYQGTVPPKDEWVVEDVTGGNFWIFVEGTGGLTIRDNTLLDWYGYDGGGAFTAIGADTAVVGVSVAVGHGWTGTTLTYVDNVFAAFDGGPTYRANFEVSPLPPAAWLGLGMLGVLGAVRSRKRRRAM